MVAEMQNGSGGGGEREKKHKTEAWVEMESRNSVNFDMKTSNLGVH